MIRMLNMLFSDETKKKLGVHYLAVCLTLAWYYGLWFTPNIFVYEDLLADRVTFSWLATLAASGVSFLAVAFICRKAERSLYRKPQIVYLAAAVASGATALYTLWPDAIYNPAAAFIVFPLLFGISNAVIWIGLGEYHARRKSTFAIARFLTMFGIVMFITMIVSAITPHPIAVAFVSLLPVVSVCLYAEGNEKLKNTSLPVLLPKDTRRKALGAARIISATIFAACAACYYNIAIIPTDLLSPAGIYPAGMSYVVGISASGIMCIGISLWQTKLARSATGIYKFLPWMFLIASVAIALYVNGDEFLYSFSFILSVTLAGIFEAVIIAYFGTLSSRGFMATSLAFGISSAIVRLGFFMGDSCAVLYEQFPFLAECLTTETSLLLMCLLMLCVIPLLRQESVVLKLISPPPGVDEIEEVCNAAIAEFSLSKREGEILKLLARGHTCDSISKKLVISPYTAQTHVRHIYSKMNVHKRSELLAYINMHRPE